MTAPTDAELAALKVAAAAFTGRVAARDIAVLRGVAAEVLPDADPLRSGIEAFAREAPGAKGDLQRMMRLAKRLGRAVELSRLERGTHHGG